jgi:hypothetical protein
METKNIPKNFTKAAITYLLKETHLVRRILGEQELCERFLVSVAKAKVGISNIREFG